jgi:RNA ligase (TIGR02306 family)
MIRKLVTVRRVDAVTPIPGADSIEKLTIEGWSVVSQKGNFKPGDLAVYFELDSALPDGNPLWQGLVDKLPREYNDKRVHVLKTITLRGQLSQGFVIPLNEFPEITAKITADYFPNADIDYAQLRQIDFAALLGVEKWEKPIPLELLGLQKGARPAFLPKTDIERIQNIPTVIQEQPDAKWEVSVKLEGQSCTVYSLGDGNEYGVCSILNEWLLNDETREKVSWVKGAEAFAVALHKYCVEKDLQLSIDGELMGPGINGNIEKFTDYQFFVFNAYDIREGRNLTPEGRISLINALWFFTNVSCKHVPIIAQGCTFAELDIPDVADMLRYADGPSIKAAKREGLVFKRTDGKQAFKVVSNAYLKGQK